jgi:hypothetical protein
MARAKLPMLAGPRDASFFRSPGRSRGRYHIITGDGGGACGLPMVDERLGTPASDVPEDERCQRPGCKAAYKRNAQP